MFDFDETIKMEELITIASGEWTAVNLLTDANGLLDVDVVVTGPTQTGFVATLSAEYGTLKNKIAITGFLKTDFTLFNVTDNSAVTITTATENPDGTYTFVIPSQTLSDVLRLTASKNGYEFPSTLITVLTS